LVHLLTWCRAVARRLAVQDALLQALPVVLAQGVGLAALQGVDRGAEAMLQLGLGLVLLGRDDQRSQVIAGVDEAAGHRLGLDEDEHVLGERELKGHHGTILLDRSPAAPYIGARADPPERGLQSVFSFRKGQADRRSVI